MTAFDEAFAMAYQLHYPRLVRFIAGLGGSDVDADDIAQETFLRLHRRGDPIGGENVRFWLFRVARNLTLNAMRRRRVWARVQKFAGVVPVIGADAQEALEREELSARCRRLLRQLPADLREALLLREWEEMTYDEIATTLGVSVAKVKTDLFRARQRLRDALRGEEEARR